MVSGLGNAGALAESTVVTDDSKVRCVPRGTTGNMCRVRDKALASSQRTSHDERRARRVYWSQPLQSIRPIGSTVILRGIRLPDTAVHANTSSSPPTGPHDLREPRGYLSSIRVSHPPGPMWAKGSMRAYARCCSFRDTLPSTARVAAGSALARLEGASALGRSQVLAEQETPPSVALLSSTRNAGVPYAMWH
jgi:hypothetical protein